MVGELCVNCAKREIERIEKRQWAETAGQFKAAVERIKEFVAAETDVKEAKG